MCYDELILGKSESDEGFLIYIWKMFLLLSIAVSDLMEKFGL